MANSNAVTLYTKPGCVQCTASERALNDNKVKYNAIDITEDDGALGLVKELGYLSAPVITTPNDHWSGFRPDKIKETAQLLQAA